jgi:hypothetical protein
MLSGCSEKPNNHFILVFHFSFHCFEHLRVWRKDSKFVQSLKRQKLLFSYFIVFTRQKYTSLVSKHETPMKKSIMQEEKYLFLQHKNKYLWLCCNGTAAHHKKQISRRLQTATARHHRETDRQVGTQVAHRARLQVLPHQFVMQFKHD